MSGPLISPLVHIESRTQPPLLGDRQFASEGSLQGRNTEWLTPEGKSKLIKAGLILLGLSIAAGIIVGGAFCIKNMSVSYDELAVAWHTNPLFKSYRLLNAGVALCIVGGVVGLGIAIYAIAQVASTEDRKSRL